MINRVLKITVMMLGISMISLGVTKEIGVNLDLARQYYSVQVIKKFIDNISSSGGNFLHLHISDDENYGIESEILGQTTGLPSFWILFSILLFGGIFGIVGMIIGVPTFAIVYRFLSRQSALALAKKDLSTESESYLNLNYIDKETKVYVKTDEEV